MKARKRWHSLLNFLWRKRPADTPKRPADKPKRRTKKPVAATPVDSIELRHLDEVVAAQVRAFFAGEMPDFTKDGGRAVQIPHPLKEGVNIKIKGAGLYGRGIQFGTRRETGPKAPLFDFDGRMMEDVASGHDNAYVGGATFQQAVIEYRVTQLLASLGYPVVPCLGYGRVERSGLSSWCSVFEMQRDWASVSPPKFSMEEYCATNVALGALLRDLAVKHDLIGYAGYVGIPGGERHIKDLHPFRMADPVSMSQISWVMQLSFGLHTLNLATIHYTKKLTKVPEGIKRFASARSCRAPQTPTTRALQQELVTPYMRGVPASFDQRDLVAVLRGNPITEAMLDLCPAKYERY